jgi:DNA 3'-phosphatase
MKRSRELLPGPPARYADMPLALPADPRAPVQGRLYPPCALPHLRSAATAAECGQPLDVTAGISANKWLCTRPYSHALAWSGWHGRTAVFPSLCGASAAGCPLAEATREARARWQQRAAPSALPARLSPESLGHCAFYAHVPRAGSSARASEGGGGGGASSSSSSSSSSGSSGRAEADPHARVLPSSAILFLDIDDTLIKTQHGGGWQWLYPTVPQRVRAYFEAGYKVVLVTNQCLVQDSEATAREKLGKMQGVAAALGVPCQVFMATHRDFCYKPYPGAFWLLAGVCNGGVPIHAPSCLYVGDAAGRLGDHSLADLGFALNIGAPATTPEAFFGGEQSALLVRPLLFLRGVADFAPGEVARAQEALQRAGIALPTLSDVKAVHEAKAGKEGDKRPLDLVEHFLPAIAFPKPGSAVLVSSAGVPPEGGGGGGGGGGGAPPRAAASPWSRTLRGAPPPPANALQEVVLLCGPPGCGKSTLSRYALPAAQQRYGRFCQDEMKSPKAFKDAVKGAYDWENLSVVVDKTLVSPKARDEALRAVLASADAPGTFAPPGGVRALALQKDDLTLARCLHGNCVRVYSPLSSRLVAEPQVRRQGTGRDDRGVRRQCGGDCW